MRVTVTSKGQITLPKKIRDALGIAAGARLDFQLAEGGRIEARVVEADPRAIVGLLSRPGRKPASVERMNAAVKAAMRRRHRRAKS